MIAYRKFTIITEGISMETAQPTIRVLFDSPRVYIIPNYQRTYVWNRYDQWEPLWFDVVNIAEQLMSFSEGSQIEALKPHFLGAAVIKEVTRSGEEPRKFVVVDGQQRLTTIQLLLTAMGASFGAYDGLRSQMDTVRSLTVNYVAGRLHDSEPDKVKPLAGDFLPFQQILSAVNNGSEMPPQSGNIGRCYDFFSSRVSEWLSNKEKAGWQIESLAKSLLIAVSDKLQVVAIWLVAGENESAIFEALNARGEPLSEWEKVKNSILAKAGELPQQIDQGKLYAEHLEYFDAPEWQRMIGRGRGSRRISDLFLDYRLESQIKQPVEERRVYRGFRVELDKPANLNRLESWCAELKADGRHFQYWETENLAGEDMESIFHRRRRSLGVGALWPLLLGLSRIEMESGDRNRCFRALDSFIFRRTILGRQARGMPGITLSLLNALPESPSGETPYSDAIIDHLTAFNNRSTDWPNNQELWQAVVYGGVNQVRLVLEGVEQALMWSKRPGNRTMQARLPIEHLMPQNHSNLADWPLPADAGEDAEAVRNAAIHRLGNLTLVETGLNSILSNKPWHQKRSILGEKDNLYINKELLNHAPEHTWDEEQIRLRGERLAGFIIKIWPHGPSTTGDITRALV